VPPRDPASNYRMVKETLLDLLPAAPARVHRIEGERSDRDAAARAYEAFLPERPDLLVLGLGADGHIASLFPHSPSLAESHRRILAVTVPKPPPERLTITPPVIHAAGLTIGLVAGAGKAEALARVLDGPDDSDLTPGRLARDGIWIVDTAAAARLASPWST
jgi:6-phosphogluconolactonase